MRRLALTTLLILAVVPAATQAQHAHSPYAGQETRAIKSLSADDIEELRRGGGWGLAKPAELNGMPGPAHLFELKDEIPLTEDQIGRLTGLFEDMRAAAADEGTRLIEGERALESAFRTRAVDATRLRRLLETIEKSRSALRFIHLSTHLDALEIVTPDQVARYNALRGYDSPAGAGDAHHGHRH